MRPRPIDSSLSMGLVLRGTRSVGSSLAMDPMHRDMRSVRSLGSVDSSLAMDPEPHGRVLLEDMTSMLVTDGEYMKRMFIEDRDNMMKLLITDTWTFALYSLE